MISAKERVKRANLYEKLDPDHKMQKIGYSYLVDEKNMILQQVQGREYDFESIADIKIR